MQKQSYSIEKLGNVVWKLSFRNLIQYEPRSIEVTVSDGETFYHHLTNSLYISDIRSKSDGDGEKCIKKFFCGRKRHSTTLSSIRLAKTKYFY